MFLQPRLNSKHEINLKKIQTTSATEKNDLLLVNLRLDVISLFLFVIAAVTRFYRLEEPRNIVLVEHQSNYIKVINC